MQSGAFIPSGEDSAMLTSDGEEFMVFEVTNTSLKKVGNVCDTIEKISGQWNIVQRIGIIESYNGEEIATEYISTTGQLTTGATVYYVLGEPQYLPLSTDSVQVINSIHSEYGDNNVTITSQSGSPSIKLTVYGRAMTTYEIFIPFGETEALETSDGKQVLVRTFNIRSE